MCGIATIAVGRSCRKRIPYPLLRNLTKELMVELSVRGQDASGIAVVNEDECFVFKKPLRPDRFVVRPKFEETLSKIGPSTNFIMLHSRMASVGGNENNLNNHPIITAPVIGIHNGTLSNDSQLFRTYASRFKPEGTVDSEVIFRLLDMYLQDGVGPMQSMQLVSKQLIGSFTGAAVDMRYPNRMIVFKFGRQLSIVKIPHYDTVIAISEVGFYDNARDRLKITAKDTCVYPKEETGLILDVNAGKITQDLVDFKLPVQEDCRKASHRWNNWVNFAG